MSCTFFGSRDTSSLAFCAIEREILTLIKEKIFDFYVGNNGNFDRLVQLALIKIRKEYDINVHIVLSYIDEKALCQKQELTEFPSELAHVPRRFAICKRNELMLKRASVVITNSKNTVGNSHSIVKRAEKMGKRIIYV